MSRYLGQHFLVNKSAINKIVVVLGLEKGDTIVEIGPGEGALTFPLVEECKKIGCKIIAIEKDTKLINELRIKNQELREVIDFTHGDVLKELPSLIHNLQSTNQRYKIVGNIPYYITGKLLRIFSDLIINYKLQITDIVLTIQKEVAERIVAKSPKMNLLAAAVQIWAEPKIIEYLKPKDFSPPPKVESAIVKLIPKPIILNAIRYYALVRIIFKQPRKTILNNLEIGWKLKKDEILKILRSVGLNGNERPQNLDIEIIQRLAMTLD